MCPPVSALAVPPNLVRHVSAICPPCVCFGRASKPCPAPHVSTLCPLWSKPCAARVTLALSITCPPYVRFGFSSKPRPSMCPSGLAPASPCIRLASALLPSVSAMCPHRRFFFSRCPLVVLFIRSSSVFGPPKPFVGFWPGLWFGFGRAFVNSASVLWFLRLRLFCVRCLPAVRLVTFKPPNLWHHVSVRPRVRLSTLAAPPSVVSTLPSVSAMRPLLVYFSLSSRCPLVVRSLSAL